MEMDDISSNHCLGDHTASPADHDIAPGDMECDFCPGKKRKAVKSCVECKTYHCEDHIELHLQSAKFKEHKLVEACELQEKICSQHGELINIYCWTDQRFMCYVCMMKEHNGHDTVIAEEERSKKQHELEEMQLQFQQRLQTKVEMMQKLKQSVDSIKMRAQAAVDDNERIFTELISFMKKMRSEVTKKIRALEKAELSRLEQLLKPLDNEIADLERRVTEMEKLSQTEDHVQFLQSFPSLCASPGFEDSPGITANQHLSFDGVQKSLSALRKRIEEIFEEEFNKILHLRAVAVQNGVLSDPKREDFLQYFRYLTLDPNTAHDQLILTERSRAVTRVKEAQQYSQHPERFDSSVQVLCRESVCGRCYWEVELKGMGVDISVSYKDIKRKGESKKCEFGNNSKSWNLQCYPSSLSFWYNNNQTKLPGPSPSRIGVYVDHSGETLSFYSISDGMSLLHSVRTTFTQPLYAGFRMCYYNSTMNLCDQK